MFVTSFKRMFLEYEKLYCSTLTCNASLKKSWFACKGGSSTSEMIILHSKRTLNPTLKSQINYKDMVAKSRRSVDFPRRSVSSLDIYMERALGNNWKKSPFYNIKCWNSNWTISGHTLITFQYIT